MPHQKPDIRKQSYLGLLDAHFTGKTGGVHIWALAHQQPTTGANLGGQKPTLRDLGGAKLHVLP